MSYETTSTHSKAYQPLKILKKIPIIFTINFLTFIIINVIVSNTKKNDTDYVGDGPPKGITNFVYKFYGALTFYTANWTNIAWWLPGVYIELVRGHVYMLLVFLLTAISSMASPYLYYSASGYTQYVIFAHCCSSYTWGGLLGATNATLPFFILKNPENIIHWAWLLFTNFLVIHGYVQFERYPLPFHILNLIYVCLISFAAIFIKIKKPGLSTKHKFKLFLLSFLVFLLVFLQFGLNERKEFNEQNEFEGLHHAGPYLFVGLCIILIEIYTLRFKNRYIGIKNE